MKITKANVQDRYVVITNDFAQDNTLSLEAKGMLLLMASRPNDWVFHKSELMKECSIGRDKINRIFKELEQNGNLCITQSFDAEGRFKSNEYVLFVDKNDNPAFIPLTEKRPPFTDLPLTDLPYTANQHLQKKDINKVNINTNINDSSVEQSHDLVEKAFEFFWADVWKPCKKAKGKTDTSPKGETFRKKWKTLFNQTYFKTHSHDDFRKEINTMAQFCREAHAVDGFNRFENMQLAKFLTQKQWRD